MHKVVHGLVAAGFGMGCWFLWAMLTLVAQTAQRALSGDQIPAFTRLCLDLRPIFVVLPLLAAAYCLFVWVSDIPVVIGNAEPVSAAARLRVVTLPVWPQPGRGNEPAAFRKRGTVLSGKPSSDCLVRATQDGLAQAGGTVAANTTRRLASQHQGRGPIHTGEHRWSLNFLRNASKRRKLRRLPRR